ncbi:MAG: hypothetical protein QOH14_2990, partial [Pseudonocardiales bacterium]|nr:hypothetical protein [Pseudonocardiales bacterium]
MLTVERGRPRRPLGPPTRRVDRPRPRTDLIAVGSLIVLIGLGLLNLRALGAGSLADHQVMVIVAGACLFLVVRRFRTASLRLLG